MPIVPYRTAAYRKDTEKSVLTVLRRLKLPSDPLQLQVESRNSSNSPSRRRVAFMASDCFLRLDLLDQILAYQLNGNVATDDDDVVPETKEMRFLRNDIAMATAGEMEALLFNARQLLGSQRATRASRHVRRDTQHRESEFIERVIESMDRYQALSLRAVAKWIKKHPKIANDAPSPTREAQRRIPPKASGSKKSCQEAPLFTQRG